MGTAAEAPALRGHEQEHFVVDPLGDGWFSWNLKHPSRFHATLEPLRARVDPMVTPGMARGRLRMVPVLRHSNLGGAVHGGVTMSLIDMALFTVPILHGLLADGYAMTVDLNNQFVGAGRLDEPMDAVVEVVRSTRRLLFLRGLVVQGEDDDHLVASFTATVRKPTPAN